jgi:DNA-binding SARP family transcriptional activator
MGSPPLRIQLCGRLAVEAGGRRLDESLPGGLGRLLLAYLVVNRDRPVGRDELLGVLWDEDAPEADPLSPLVSRLRKALGPEVIAGRSELRFADDGSVFVDVDWAVDALHRAEAHAAAGEWGRVWSLAHNAFHIAKRPFLVGYESPWIEEWRRRLDIVKVRGLELFATSGLALGSTALGAAERAARQLVEMAPFRETGYRILMEVLEVQGNAAEALLVYERLRSLLGDELGVSPSPAVQEVYLRLLG